MAEPNAGYPGIDPGSAIWHFYPCEKASTDRWFGKSPKGKVWLPGQDSNLQPFG